MQVASIAEGSPTGTKTLPLQFGHHVTDGELLGIVYSKDLGEKKSELVDAISQLRLDQDNLEAIEDLYKKGASTEVVVRQARRNVEQDRIAVSKAERTLRTWQLPEDEIQDVMAEAERVIARRGERDKEKESSSAPLEPKSPIDAIIPETNFPPA